MTAGLGSDSGITTPQPYYLHLYSVSGSTATLLQTYTSANVTFNDGAWLQWSGLSVALAANSTYAWSFGRANSAVAAGRRLRSPAAIHMPAARSGFFPRRRGDHVWQQSWV